MITNITLCATVGVICNHPHWPFQPIRSPIVACARRTCTREIMSFAIRSALYNWPLYCSFRPHRWWTMRAVSEPSPYLFRLSLKWDAVVGIIPMTIVYYGRRLQHTISAAWRIPNYPVFRHPGCTRLIQWPTYYWKDSIDQIQVVFTGLEMTWNNNVT